MLEIFPGPVCVLRLVISMSSNVLAQRTLKCWYSIGSQSSIYTHQWDICMVSDDGTIASCQLPSKTSAQLLPKSLGSHSFRKLIQRYFATWQIFADFWECDNLNARFSLAGDYGPLTCQLLIRYLMYFQLRPTVLQAPTHTGCICCDAYSSALHVTYCVANNGSNCRPAACPCCATVITLVVSFH
jgi:hypothetical protein